jgi:hypothetical protein
MRYILNIIALLLFAFPGNVSVCAQNPVIQTIYTADPAPMFYNDTVYLYTGHDEDSSTWFTMKDWHVFSTTDMVNWTDLGSPLSISTFSWAKKDAWAGQCTFRNGKFYWYVPVNQANGKGMAIGVAVSDHPDGPFTDALGKPLVHSGPGDIDPSVFIDDDGQAYLYWGNPYLKYVELNDDMISWNKEVGIVNVPLTKEGFGVRYKDPKRSTEYEEGPWLYKRKGLYYLIYPAGGVPEHLAYSTSNSPTGPWVYRDTIMPVIGEGGAFTNHPGIIDYKGKSFLFYHNGALPGGGGFDRSVCVEEFKYNKDGTIPRIKNTTEGVVHPVGHLNPFRLNQAETIAWEKGVEVSSGKDRIYVTDITNGDYIKVRSVDFEKGAKSFEANTASGSTGGTINIRLDSPEGKLAGTCKITNTGGWQSWKVLQTKIEKINGIHDVYFVFNGEEEGNLFNFDSWKFNKK